MRPEYIERRIDFHLARQKARRTHPQPCPCPYCVTSEQIEAKLRERIEQGKDYAQEIDF